MIDAVFQVGSDNLYKLDLKLREIKDNIKTGDGEKPFGGIAVFFFGDIMQLRPVKGKFVLFENHSYSFCFQVVTSGRSLQIQNIYILLSCSHHGNCSKLSAWSKTTVKRKIGIMLTS